MYLQLLSGPPNIADAQYLIDLLIIIKIIIIINGHNKCSISITSYGWHYYDKHSRRVIPHYCLGYDYSIPIPHIWQTEFITYCFDGNIALALGLRRAKVPCLSEAIYKSMPAFAREMFKWKKFTLDKLGSYPRGDWIHYRQVMWKGLKTHNVHINRI